MGMGIPRPEVPDAYGLPIFKVTKIIKQRVGNEVHLMCGAEVFGQVQWLYIAVMSAADLIVESRECALIAQDGWNDFQMSISPDH